MSSLMVQIPENHFGFFTEIFETAVQNPIISVKRKCRITQFFADLQIQKTENDKLIYTSYSKSEVKKMLLDLQLFYRNTGQITLETKVDGLLKELEK